MSALGYTNLGLRLFFFCFVVISLGLTGHLRSYGYHLARNNLGIAASSIGLLFSFLLAVPLIFFGGSIGIIITLILDFISFSLLLSAAASLTQDRKYCHYYFKNRGRPDKSGKCGEIRAAVGFLYMDWIILLFAFIITVWQYFAGSTVGRTHHTGRPTGSSSGGFRTRFINRGHYSTSAPVNRDAYLDQGADEYPAATAGSGHYASADATGPSTLYHGEGGQAYTPTQANTAYEGGVTTVGGTMPNP